MRPAKIAALVVGAVLALVSVGLLAGGGALVWLHAFERDDGGFYASDDERLETPTYAVTSDEVDLDLHVVDWVPDDLATVRLDAERIDGGDVFVGIGAADDVAAYLSGSAHDRLDDIDARGADRYVRVEAGERQPAPPATESFWVASATGPDAASLTWEVDDGRWTAVVMNADASLGVEVDATAAVRTGLLLPIGIGLLVLAVLVGGAAAALAVFALSNHATTPVRSTSAPAHAAGYPVRLTGELDPELSRGLWLVKWFLAIPHLLVLAVLWPLTFLLTIVAGFSILFTGRYPRSIFDFNVGVMRWSWRVTFYAFTLGTDRYPPFGLSSDPAYPADLDVDPPGELSRGLVLVKWWLLAIPHYVIVGVFGGGFTWWAWGARGDDGRFLGGMGLIGILAFVAGVALLFTRRYPRSIFDFVMGMQRWSYRVLAYAALMTDAYPPFRLDPGGHDPGSPPVPTAAEEGPPLAA